jgi:hypothetical protein
VPEQATGPCTHADQARGPSLATSQFGEDHDGETEERGGDISREHEWGEWQRTSDQSLPAEFDIVDWTRRSREHQGLSTRITDAAVLANLATLFRVTTPSKPPLRRQGRTPSARGQSDESQSVPSQRQESPASDQG